MFKKILGLTVAMLCSCGEGLSNDAVTDDGLSEAAIDASDAQRARFDFEAFRKALEARAISANSKECTLALPNSTYSTVSQAEGVIRREVGTRYGVNPNTLEKSVISCGTNNPKTCAQRFGYSVSQSDFDLAKAIKPSAETIDDEASKVRFIQWTVPNLAGEVSVAFTIAGRRDSAILGIGVYTGVKCRTSTP